MTEYHTIYKGPEGETTQWQDIQRKLGNLPPKKPVWKPEKFTPEGDEVKDQAWVDKKDPGELEELQDEFVDDRFLEEYRQKRIKEIEAAGAKPRFGTLELIRGSEFVQQVSQAGPDVWVVVLLYKDGQGASQLMMQCIEELAAKYPSTKFVKSIATDCIPSYPDSNVPTLLVYNDTRCITHLVGLMPYGGPKHMTPEQVAFVLNKHGPLCQTGSEEENAQAQLRSLLERAVAQRDAAHAAEEDESSDFEG